MQTRPDGITPSQTIGPFFHDGLELTPSPVGPDTPGERMRLLVRLVDGVGAPVTDSMIELWHADAAGRYPHPDDPRGGEVDPGFRGFARLATGDAGECEFETIRPGRVPGPGAGEQAPHFGVTVFARGLLRHLTTRAYLAGDAANEEDPVLALVPEARRDTLLARPDPERAGVWRFTIRLQGEGETVFFDV